MVSKLLHSKKIEVVGQITAAPSEVDLRSLGHFKTESAMTVPPNSDIGLGQCHVNGSNKNPTCLNIGA